MPFIRVDFHFNIFFAVRVSHLFRMGRRQSVVDQPRHRPEHGTPVLARVRFRVATAVLRVPDVLRQQNPLHAAETVQSHVQDVDQGRQVRSELFRVGRGARKAGRQQLGPAQLLSVPQVSVPAPERTGRVFNAKKPVGGVHGKTIGFSPRILLLGRRGDGLLSTSGNKDVNK